MKRKMKILPYIFMVVIVCVLLCGIFSIAKRLTGTSSAGPIKDDKQVVEKSEEVTQEEKVDNSVPMTKLVITPPAGYLRVGNEMQLSIETEPKDATNTKLKWSCSTEGGISVTEDGILTADKKAEKSTVTVTAEATDGSGLKQEFTLRVYPEIDPSKPMVAITFDDGPNPDTTNAMLDAFEENYALATFFCLGQNAGYYPEVVKREYELGMEVATHTYSHKQLTKLGESELDAEIQKSIDNIKDAIGVAPKLMRPPYGDVNKTVLAAVGGYGLCCMNWSLDTEDWKTKNADATYNQVMKAVDGDVVLLHDIHEYNVAAVQRFVPDLIEKGFQLVTVPELYENRGETLDPGTLHYRTDPTTESTGETEPASTEDAATP